MHILGISGSPRKNSNSEILLRHALAPFVRKNWKISEIHLSKMNIAPCSGCDNCLDTGDCSIHDDMEILYGEFAECDAIIISSPVYYRNVPAQLKAVFDRSYSQKDTRPLANKAGGAIAVGRGQGGGQSLVLTVIYNYFLSSGVLGIPGELNGVSAVADQPGDILRQPKRLEQARMLGENVLRFAELISK